MTLKDLWDVSPQTAIFIVERDDEFNVTSREEYHGGKITGQRKVSRVLPVSYPMRKYVMEVELQ